MPLPTKFAQAGRWTLIAAAVLMGGALLATVWSTNRGVRDASTTLMRGQADVLYDQLRFQLGQMPGPATPAALAPLIEEHAADGLLYLAVLDAEARIVAAAGAPVAGRAELEAAFRDAPVGIPVAVGDRVRSVFRRQPRAEALPRTTARGEGIVIEFEPHMATELHATARRALGIGVLAAGTLLLVALGLVRWFVHREALERQLEHERRLASLGQMSAVLAHEIRNPLASLKGNAQLLARSLPEGERSRAKAERVVSEAVRLETLTNDLLDFARAGEIRRGDVDPAALLRDAAASIETDRIRVDAERAPGTWRLDGERMRQVLTNLLENAVQAGDAEVVASVARDGGELVFEVRDRGEGIPAEELGRIFEPFYTRRIHGTGLGLAVARRLVELHGGTITADNAADGGALFRVTVPKT